ncbi:hypothetical protein SAMN04489760_10883 [Syntrophus gentianae]|uniref:Uncharacterized protein n=1 Tax=Syntrophus gentianae TaxID=43775 RepID=A0A1H7WY21_9BACT|nr:hypothetical protein [Syntrophus gentianae]SEM26195.1 hypothetical protein SAMN04489760_10883 [Syntrophus gentianae]
MKIFFDRRRGNSRETFFSAVFLRLIALFLLGNLLACGAQIGQTVISQPDEYIYTYEAKEKFILRAIARVFKEKKMGTNIRIDEEKHSVESDYLILDDWRTKSVAKVKKLNWKENEVTISVTTEKKTASGWEMRRLLEKEQYAKVFDTIDLKIYEEMYKTE